MVGLLAQKHAPLISLALSLSAKSNQVKWLSSAKSMAFKATSPSAASHHVSVSLSTFTSLARIASLGVVLFTRPAKRLVASWQKNHQLMLILFALFLTAARQQPLAFRLSQAFHMRWASSATNTWAAHLLNQQSKSATWVYALS